MKKRLSNLGLAVAVVASPTVRGDSKTAETTTAASTTESSAAGETIAADEAAETTEAAGGVIKIGGIGPTTDGAAVYGLAIQRGAQLIVDETNAAGGVNGAQVEFKSEDDEHGVEKSVNAYNTLKDWDMQALMGTVTSAPCTTIADEMVSDNTLQITPSGSTVERAANPSAFRIYFPDPDQGTAPVKYIGENKLAPKIAVIYDSSDVYSSGIYEKFAEESKNQGLETIAAEAFTADSNKDFSTQLQKAKDADAELVLPPIYYTKVSPILQQADKTGFVPQFFGCDDMDGILQVQSFDIKLAEGLILPTPFAADASDDLTANSVKSYKSAYSEVPVQFVADAYDAIYAIRTAMENVGVISGMDASATCDALKTSMLNIRLDGLTGEGMTWTKDGEPHKASKAVEVVDGAYIVI